MTLDASIIITAYNVERYIARAIESALAQRDVTIEIIVIDDGSSDGTWQIISAITDPRIRAFRMEQNGGPGAARNKGMDEAYGEWIVMLDGDDAMEVDRLSRCIATARAQQAQIVVDNLMVCREADGKEFPMFAPKHFADLHALELVRFIRSVFPSAGGYTLGYLKPVFSTSFIRSYALRYRAELRIGEDYCMLADALASGGKCAVEPSAGYRYTVRADSISYRLTLDHIRSMQAANKEFETHFSLDAETLKALRARANWFDEHAAYALLVEALKQRSLRGALSAIKTRPGAVRLLWEPVSKRLKSVVG